MGTAHHAFLQSFALDRLVTALDLRNELEELKGEIDAGVHSVVSAGGASPSRSNLE